MKKETLMAVILGVVLGIGVAAVMLLQTRKGDQPKVVPIAASSNITPQQSRAPTRDNNFELSEPEDNIITDTKDVVLKGKTTKGSLIIIQSPVSLKTVKTDKDTFSIDFPLALGENVISISAYAPDSKGSVREKQLTIFYLTEK